MPPNVAEAKQKLERLQLVEINYSEELRLTPLHWMLADKQECIVLEATEKGMEIYENPVKVLTNNPPFPFQMMNLCQYRGLSSRQIPCDFADEVELEEYSRGMGALGLPGDLSSVQKCGKCCCNKKQHGEGKEFFQACGILARMTAHHAFQQQNHAGRLNEAAHSRKKPACAVLQRKAAECTAGECGDTEQKNG